MTDVASYMAENPSLQVGIDGERNSGNQTLSDRRVSSVRDALIVAGVPSHKVQVGAFGDQRLSRDGRVEMLLITAPGQVGQNVTSQ